MNNNINPIDKDIYLKYKDFIGKEEINFILNHLREYFSETMPIVTNDKPFNKGHLFCHRYQNFEVAIYSKYLVLFIDVKKFNPTTNYNNKKYLLN